MNDRLAGMPRLSLGVVCLATCLCFCALSWVAAFGIENPTRPRLLGILGVAYLSAMPLYFLCRKATAPALPWWGGAFLVGVLTLVTPSLLQTDQLRYLWDGLQSLQGANPFRLTPREALTPLGENAPAWAASINHPELPTIYPPGAQLAFLLGAFFNPLFVSDAALEWLRPWLASLPRTFFWPYEWGWRWVVALSIFWTVFLLRRSRWDLLVFHPLFLLVVVMNVHVDALVLPFFVWMFRPFPSDGHDVTSGIAPGLALGLGVLVRWTPAFFVPPFFVSWRRHLGTRAGLGALLVAASLVALGVAFYWRGAEGRFFASTKVYGEHWMFFGYLHRFVADGIGLVGWADQRIFLAKASLAVGFLAFAFVVVWRQAQRVFSLRLTCLLVMCAALAISPTLHPWYLLALVCVGLPYTKTLRFPWVWPLLAPASYAFYLEGKDPLVVRLLVYGVVSACVFVDFRRLFRSRTAQHV